MYAELLMKREPKLGKDIAREIAQMAVEPTPPPSPTREERRRQPHQHQENDQEEEIIQEV